MLTEMCQPQQKISRTYKYAISLPMEIDRLLQTSVITREIDKSKLPSAHPPPADRERQMYSSFFFVKKLHYSVNIKGESRKLLLYKTQENEGCWLFFLVLSFTIGIHANATGHRSDTHERTYYIYIYLKKKKKINPKFSDQIIIVANYWYTLMVKKKY